MAYSRHFNRDAINGDSLRRSIDPHPPEVCKTGFHIHDVVEWMDYNPLNEYLNFVAIVTVRREIDDKRIFRMESYNSAGKYLFYLDGDLPCPDQCVPPDGEPIVPPDNTFSKADIMAVRSFNEIKILNVHSALSFPDGTPKETHSIYAVTLEGQIATAHTGPNDPVFTSIDYKAQESPND